MTPTLSVAAKDTETVTLVEVAGMLKPVMVGADVSDIPVPLSAASKVAALAALDAMCRVADFAPAEVGTRVTATVQVDPAAKIGVRLAQVEVPLLAILN